MRALLENVLQRYGMPARVETTSGTVETRVFFRSVNSEAWYSAERMVYPSGERQRGRYICLLPAGIEVQIDDTLTVDGRQFLLRRIEPTAAFSETVCQWCLCVEKGSVTDGS